jgi:DNA-binding MarR family transcriptional regulator
MSAMDDSGRSAPTGAKPSSPIARSGESGGARRHAFEFDELLLSQGRLAIVTALVVPGRIEFVELRKLLAMSAGNLSVHSSKLEAAGYLRIEKDFVGKRPRTTFFLTDAGRRALVSHVRRLNQALDPAGM